MKKSELRNIIRESIKELISEQTLSSGFRVRACKCLDYYRNPSKPGCGPGSIVTNTSYPVTIDGQTPQIGDQFHYQMPPDVPSVYDGIFVVEQIYPAQAPCTAGTATWPNAGPHITNINGFCDFKRATCRTYDPPNPPSYGFHCKTLKNKPGEINQKQCVPGTAQNVGTFATLQYCLDSGCQKNPVRTNDDFIDI